MRISTKGRYALRMMIDLAIHADDGYVALKDIARRQDISKKYLEQIIPLLGRSELLTANRGYQGGYKLAKPASRCTIAEILSLTEGSLAPVACLETADNKCPCASECITLPMWKGLYDVIYKYLDGITLQDMIDDFNARGIADYCI